MKTGLAAPEFHHTRLFRTFSTSPQKVVQFFFLRSMLRYQEPWDWLRGTAAKARTCVCKVPFGKHGLQVFRDGFGGTLGWRGRTTCGRVGRHGSCVLIWKPRGQSWGQGLWEERPGAISVLPVLHDQFGDTVDCKKYIYNILMLYWKCFIMISKVQSKHDSNGHELLL